MTDTIAVTGAFAPAEIQTEIQTNSTDLAHTNLPEVAAQDAVAETAVQATEAPPAEKAPNGFELLGLAPELLKAVADMGFEQPTSVQLKTIPLAMGNLGEQGEAAKFNDLMVSSQTGSGKTAAFLLPVLHTLLAQQAAAVAAEREAYEKSVAEAQARGEAPPKRQKRKDPTNPRNFKAAAPGALILCPTRELAQQVAHDAIDLVRHCSGLRIANIVGGMPYQLQIAKLQNANLVVATPGRLLDLQRSMQIKLDEVQFLVVDEADRMLDLGFSDDLAEVNQLTIARRQTMMFSATFAPRIQQLAARVMRAPQKVTLDNPQEKHANIRQVLFWADNAVHKRKLLDHWLRDTSINQAIVFASTQIECDGLANDLQQAGFDAVALHGALSQGLRNRRLMALRNGQVQILVATDVAARGIDVPTISHVFNFGLPMKPEDFTHRIGRTGRAGRDGLAVTFAEFRDRRKIMDIESYTRHPMDTQTIPGLEPQQRMPAPRSGAPFGARGRGGFETPSRDRKFGPARDIGFGADRFAARGPRAAAPGEGRGGFAGKSGNTGHAGHPGVGTRDYAGAAREGFSYERKGGFNDRFAGQGAPRPDRAPRGAEFAARNESPARGEHGPRSAAPGRGEYAPRGEARPARGEFAAPRGEFAPRKPAYSKPAGHAARGPSAGKVFVPRDARKRTARNTD